MCHSEFNRLSAHLFAKRHQDVLADMEAWGLCRLRESLLQTRTECIQRCIYVSNLIYPCLSSAFLTLPPGAEDKEVLRLPIKDLTASRGACCLALKRLLYAPCLNPHAMAQARLLCDRLHAAGHTEAARVLWLYTAWSISSCSGSGSGSPQPEAPPPVAAAALPMKRAQCSPSSSE